jgi:anti-sigma factor RsiW
LNSATDAYRDWDVAYVLGSLSPPERKAYERHLGGCASCAREVASLAGLPGILLAVSREQATEMLGADSRAPAILPPGRGHGTHASRRCARLGATVALTGAVLGALVVWLSLAEGRSPPG